MKYFIGYCVLMVMIVVLMAGCFDTTLQPPPDTIGEIVGCIEASNSIYCVTEYPVAPVSLETVVNDVLENSLRFEKQIVTVTGEVGILSTDSIIVETGTDRVTIFVSDAAAVWDLEDSESYHMTIYIENINRDRHEYDVWAHPVVNNLLGNPAVKVAPIVRNTLEDTKNWSYTAFNLTGIVSRTREDSIALETNTEDFHISIYAEADPHLLSGYAVGSEVTLPVFLTFISRPSENQDFHFLAFDLIK